MTVEVPCYCCNDGLVTVIHNGVIISIKHPGLEQELEAKKLYPNADVSVCAYIVGNILDVYEWTKPPEDIPLDGGWELAVAFNKEKGVYEVYLDVASIPKSDWHRFENQE